MTATRGNFVSLPSGGGLSCTLLLNGTVGAALVAALIQTMLAWPNLSLIPTYLMLSTLMAGIGALTGLVASLTSLLARRVVLLVATSRAAEAWVVLLGAFPGATDRDTSASVKKISQEDEASMKNRSCLVFRLIVEVNNAPSRNVSFGLCEVNHRSHFSWTIQAEESSRGMLSVLRRRPGA